MVKRPCTPSESLEQSLKEMKLIREGKEEKHLYWDMMNNFDKEEKGEIIMKKKPLSMRIKNLITTKIINLIRYHNTRWCFDETECTNKTQKCEDCPYYLNSQD